MATAIDNGENPPSKTLYVKNLDERIKIPRLTEGLRELFAEYGNIVEIVAKKNIKARGQAFIVYDNEDSAQEAMDELQAFDLFGKPLNLDFAKSRSDKTVEAEDGEEGLEVHKKRRLAEKERKKAEEAAERSLKRPMPIVEALTERPGKSAKPTPAVGAVIPDEYLPPNKIIFLRELPDDYDTAALTVIFGRFLDFKEVRTVPGRKGIAFVEYKTEEGAISAKEATAGMVLGDKTIRVTFQRK